jgi:hypothetical protein
MAIQPQVTAGGSRQRLLLLAAIGLAVVALALLVLRPLLLGGVGPVAAPEAVNRAGAVPRTTTGADLIGPATTTATPGGAAGSLRDPFQPLAAGAAVAGATPTTLATSQATVPGAGGGTATAAGGGSTAGQKVVLLDVFSKSGTRYAKVSVDGTRYTVKEGQVFASSYRVVDIGTACASFESGTTPFTLCEGEAVLK